MTRFHSRAIVLGSEIYGESDLNVHAVTPGRGRLYAVAKGAMRSKKRFTGVFRTCQLLEAGFMTAPRSGRPMIEHASVIHPFAGFSEGPARLARACLLLEVAGACVPEYQASGKEFELLKNGLYRTHDDPDTDRWPVTYAFRLLSETGLAPGLDSCLACMRPAHKDMVFSAEAGGALCRQCFARETETSGMDEQAAVELSLDAARTITEIIRAPEQRLSRTTFTKNALSLAKTILSLFMAYQLAGPSKSLHFMSEFEGFRKNTSAVSRAD